MTRSPLLALALPLLAASALAGCTMPVGQQAQAAESSWTSPTLGRVITVRPGETPSEYLPTAANASASDPYAVSTTDVYPVGTAAAAPTEEPRATDAAPTEEPPTTDAVEPEVAPTESVTAEAVPEQSAEPTSSDAAQVTPARAGTTHKVAAGTFELTVDDLAQALPPEEGRLLGIGVEGGWQLIVTTATSAVAAKADVDAQCRSAAENGPVERLSRTLGSEPASGCSYVGRRTSGQAMSVTHAGGFYVVQLTAPQAELAADADAVLGTWVWITAGGSGGR